MSTQVDHSANLPREFAQCPGCKRKGIYKARPVQVAPSDWRTPIRCRYCGVHKLVRGGFTTLENEASLILIK